MNQVTTTGQTVDKAIESALKELNTTRDYVEVKIIDEGKKGVFGIFGSRPAIVKVMLKIDPVEEAKQFLKDVCRQMDVDVTIHAERDGKRVFFSLSGENIGNIIGKRGKTLNALQTLTQIVLNHHSSQFLIAILDAENYRKRREESLIQLANHLARKVIREGKQISLEPMPSYERKIIHSALANEDRVTTYSVGTEPNRHLVIAPK
ncbi:RNA-binding cell elongation regulator Jag/EloR [Fervidibacillus halotolerans]|uniref:RNA-binding protein KhpB n=1 Tax=Fervidibacillus halotolerans TaxID=2980027 RepID=A0A9E8M0Y3_9BACI|nr:RNA-binding cell elongation regulator Jag/EloR [Fervidibacillus halotolerans]WAA12294.1 protein jag [Fervidibacillus halotolerans]